MFVSYTVQTACWFLSLPSRVWQNEFQCLWSSYTGPLANTMPHCFIGDPWHPYPSSGNGIAWIISIRMCTQYSTTSNIASHHKIIPAPGMISTPVA